MSPLTLPQRLARCHILIAREPETAHLGPICLIGTNRIAPAAELGLPYPTAGTDGVNKVYASEFIETLTDPEFRALVLHENLHVAGRHLTLYADLYAEDPENANRAADYWINSQIVSLAAVVDTRRKPGADGEAFATLPKGGCYDPKYDGMSVRQIYADLRKNGQGGKGGKGGQGSQDFHDWAKAQGMSEPEAQEIEEDIRKALRQGLDIQRRLGGGAAGQERAFSDVFAGGIDYSQAFRDWLSVRVAGDEYSTWARPSRRFIGQDLYMPSQYSEAVARLGVFVDTSGSIGEEDLRYAMGELGAAVDLLHPARVEILYWDSSAYGPEVFEGADCTGENILWSTRPKGGGGTSPRCIVQHYKHGATLPTVAIWISDGYTGGDFAEDLGIPSLWCIVPGGVMPPAHINALPIPQQGK